ncbi:hypothetical protein NDU88_000943 [Pleurodeles waltl]|uniref:Uncharacterized protein n=1 Tax=Pleurodeles waltl TaxID=8319 RepID=A0AAV7TH87_PLEWA|nr:hypothetical protein NDU88_000943 [Pleurodeles waltl]
MKRGAQLTTTTELGPWHAADLHTLVDLYNENGLISFSELSAEMGLPSGQFLLYNSLLIALSRKWGEGVALQHEDAMGVRKYPPFASWDELLTHLHESEHGTDTEDAVAHNMELMLD